MAVRCPPQMLCHTWFIFTASSTYQQCFTSVNFVQEGREQLKSKDKGSRTLGMIGDRLYATSSEHVLRLWQHATETSMVLQRPTWQRGGPLVVPVMLRRQPGMIGLQHRPQVLTLEALPLSTDVLHNQSSKPAEQATSQQLSKPAEQATSQQLSKPAQHSRLPAITQTRFCLWRQRLLRLSTLQRQRQQVIWSAMQAEVKQFKGRQVLKPSTMLFLRQFLKSMLATL